MVAAHAGKGAYDALHNLDGILLTWHSSEHGLHFDVKWKTEICISREVGVRGERPPVGQAGHAAKRLGLPTRLTVASGLLTIRRAPI